MRLLNIAVPAIQVAADVKWTLGTISFGQGPPGIISSYL